MLKYNYTAKRDDYLTPPEIIKEILTSNGFTEFDCDTCCLLDNIPAKFRYRKDGLYSAKNNKLSESNGLNGTWFPYNWCNPPFSICEDFVKKAVAEQKKGHTTYMLIPARTETKYWHDYILDENGGTNRWDVKVKFLRKGICFLNPDNGEKMSVYKNSLALVTFLGHTTTEDLDA